MADLACSLAMWYSTAAGSERISGSMERASGGLFRCHTSSLRLASKALTGTKIMSPPEGRVLRPSRGAASRFLRLHSKVCRLVETRLELIANPEVARALQQELLQALINCLTAGDACGNPKRKQHHADIMIRFEEALAVYGEPHLNLPALCSAIGVPERTLRMCSAEFLGMSPNSVPFAAAVECGAFGAAER